MIVFGLRKYGYVDEVEGLGTVATTFLHLMFVLILALVAAVVGLLVMGSLS